MKRFVSLFVQALNGYLLVASLLVSCTHMQLPQSSSLEDTPLSPPTRSTILPETAPLSPSPQVLETLETLIAPDVSQTQYGTASWYGRPFHGRRTASGEIYDMYEVTAAHRTAPLGTYALVTNLSNGQIVQVRINDRGPAIRRRILDLSYGAARELGMVTSGVARVKVEFLEAEAAVIGHTPHTTQVARLHTTPGQAMPVARDMSRPITVTLNPMLSRDTPLSAGTVHASPQVRTPPLIAPRSDGPDVNVASRSLAQHSTVASRAAPRRTLGNAHKADYTRTVVMVARSPGMETGIGQAVIPSS